MKIFKNLRYNSPSTNFWNIIFILLMICCCFELNTFCIMVSITFVFGMVCINDLVKRWWLLFSPVFIIFLILIIFFEYIKIFNNFLDNNFGKK